MNASATQNPVLTRFRAALDAMYGDRLERVVLFGSPICGSTSSTKPGLFSMPSPI